MRTTRAAKPSKGAVLLATDFSKPARRAYAYAVKFSSLLKKRLILLHVIKTFPGIETWSPLARRSLQSLRTKALLELGRMARVAKEMRVSAGHQLLEGIPEDAILTVAGDSHVDLIVMGTHGRTGWDRLQMGSLAETLLRKVSCPILAVHGSAAADAPLNPRSIKLKRILVATDLSASSESALHTAASLARQGAADIILVHAIEPSASDRARHPTHNPASQKAGRLLQRAVETANAESSVIESVVEPGNPVEIILEQAKRVMADIIVMGTTGRRGMRRLILGSVAEAIVRRAGCPVLVVKPERGITE